MAPLLAPLCSALPPPAVVRQEPSVAKHWKKNIEQLSLFGFQSWDVLFVFNKWRNLAEGMR